MSNVEPRTTTTPAEALAVVTVCFGLMIWQSVHAMLAGHPPLPVTNAGAVWLIIIELIFAAVALLILRARGFAVTTLFPPPSVVGTLQGAGLYLLARFAVAVALVPFGDVMQPVEHMVSDASLSIGVVVAVAVINATFEEVFLLGFLVRGLQGLGVNAAIGVSLLVRVLYHLYQGPVGAMTVLVFGAVVTLYFAVSRKLWPAVFCHMLADFLPFVSP